MIEPELHMSASHKENVEQKCKLQKNEYVSYVRF